MVKDDPVPQTSDEYIDYVTNVYNKFMTAQNKEAEAYNTEHASEIAAGTLTKQTILTRLN